MESEQVERSHITRRLYIVLFVRLVLGLVFFGISFSFFWKRGISVTSPEVVPFYIFSLLLLLFTALGAITLKYFYNKAILLYAACQICFDVIAVSVFVCLSGGGVSPFTTFYVPVVLLSSLLFGTRGAVKTAVAIVFLYLLILVFQLKGYLCCKGFISGGSVSVREGDLGYNLVVHSVTFLLSAIVAGFFVDKWHAAEDLLVSHVKRLKFLRFLHERVLENIPSGVVLTDMSGKILYANDSAANILGIGKNKLRGKKILNLLPLIENDAVDKLGGTKKNSEIMRKEIVYKYPGQDEEKIIGCSFCELKGGGAFDGYILVFQDITHIKKVQKQQRTLEDFKLVAKAASEIAHNIKNPLGAISGAAQMLGETAEIKGLEDIKQLSKIIVKESDRLNNAIRTFMQVTKSAFKTPVPERLDIGLEVKRIIEAFSMRTEIRGRFNINLVCDGTYYVLMDPQDLEVILWNLMENSCEAMENGGDITVSITSGSEESTVEISVCDEGPGIPEEYWDNIFEPFFTSKPKGTGLGLNITLQLVSRSNGKIYFDTSPDGTCFKVLLPVA